MISKARVSEEKTIVRSSIPLQMLCHTHRPIVFLWFVAEILIFVWKGLVDLPIDWTIYGFEIFALCLTLTLEYIRLELIVNANLTEQMFMTIIGFLLTLIAIVTYLYWTIWQWFVLTLDFVLGCTQLGFCLVEIILVFTAFLSFCKKPSKEKIN